ncbi:hypothetical protein IKR55_00475 [bacterium]|nr:hypothetical protein [bacterium]
MLKKKNNGSWSNISTLKKKVSGSWSYITSLKRKTNGSWVDIFFNWFNILRYSMDSGCTGVINTTTDGAIEVKNYIVYGNDCTVTVTLGKFNAVAGDTLSIDYSYDLYPHATGSSNAYANILYNINSSGQGNSLQSIFNDNAYPWDHTINSGTFNYTFSQSYNNVGVYIYIQADSVGTSYGPVDSTVKFLNIYLNGARINYDTVAIRN